MGFKTTPNLVTAKLQLVVATMASSGGTETGLISRVGKNIVQNFRTKEVRGSPIDNYTCSFVFFFPSLLSLSSRKCHWSRYGLIIRW